MATTTSTSRASLIGGYLPFRCSTKRAIRLRGPITVQGKFTARRSSWGIRRPPTNLLEGKLDTQATSESWDHYRGYKEAITSPRQLTAKQYQQKFYGMTFAWEDGYRQGYAERKTRGVKKVAF